MSLAEALLSHVYRVVVILGLPQVRALPVD